MRIEHLSILACPKTKKPLELKIIKTSVDARIEQGFLIEPISKNEYPIINFIPRFVSEENYANSFGFQWNLHTHTQNDEYTKVDVSGNRFFKETKWCNNLKGELILEAGCGAGRFTRHALSTQASVVSFDYSNAVDANYRINGCEKELLLIQADIFNMPFKENLFDKAFCFGVLQHTPYPEKAFYNIVYNLKPGGHLATDIYLKSWKSYFHVKPYIRPFVKKLSPEALYKFTQKYVNFFWPLAKVARKYRLGRLLISRVIAERSDQLGDVHDDLIKEWAYLDTFDWFSPSFDFPQTLSKFRGWHHNAGLHNIDVHYGFNGIEARATKPADYSGSKKSLTS